MRSRTLVLMIAASSLPAHAQYRDEAKPDGITARSEQLWLGQPYTGQVVATPRGADGHPSLSGTWQLLHEDGKPDGNLGKDLPHFALPYTAQGREQLAANDKVVDPEARCIITGIPRALTGVLPFEIIHTPKRLATLHQLGWHRWVWLDGRPLAQDPDPRFSGNGVGHWEGNTLVIQSNAFHDSSDGNAWLDDNGNPISSKALLTERWTRPDRNHLTLELNYSDPVYYSAPVRYTRHFVLSAQEHLREFSCEWNSWWVTNNLEPGPGRIGANGNRGFGPDNQIVPDYPLGSVLDDSRGTDYWLYRKNKPKPSDLPPTPANAPVRTQ
ncbi:hypothetical protein [Pseudoxanthomonas sp.]|uniref:hypothetical protein n=1 Tax=Pseudoxanthomonas sp. TaxID=1871049 RepID=UPI002608E6D1|nr:hypothetical protein [Pseudoxanthomonas sp.]WDS37010.1 MAG: hypothetical protein O8I58_03635 [Pseudoxanthomonas sp.]